MIRRQAAIFLLVGATTVLVDFATYTVLVRWIGVPADIAKAISFLTGTVFAYFANRFWTFSDAAAPQNSAVRFALLYGSTLGANVLINNLLLHTFGNQPYAVQLAFIGATAASAILNFVGMKWFVFYQRAAETRS